MDESTTRLLFSAFIIILVALFFLAKKIVSEGKINPKELGILLFFDIVDMIADGIETGVGFIAIPVIGDIISASVHFLGDMFDLVTGLFGAIILYNLGKDSREKTWFTGISILEPLADEAFIPGYCLVYLLSRLGFLERWSRVKFPKLW